ncbi:MAG: DUF6273 domain-containing protein [Synergistaceae bacterium]|nr:DUF6273 domain-containing protein [Synergistaceae bacterium]
MGNFKSFKKLVLLVMLVVFTASFGTPMVTPARAEDPQAGLIKIDQILNMGDPEKAGIGGGASTNTGAVADPYKTVYFGKQNGDGLLWRVLSTGDKVLLLSDKVLTTSTFGNSNVWNGSTIRGLLQEIYTKADTSNPESSSGVTFDGREKAQIAETQLTDVETGGTSDHLFLLSGKINYDGSWQVIGCEGDVFKPEYGFTNNVVSNDTRKALDTAGASAYWWLRSPFLSSYAFSVTTAGNVNNGPLDDSRGVRAALNLNPESVLFLSAANDTQGKSATTIGAFSIDNTYTGSDGWKVTLKDTDIIAPTVNSVTQTKTGGVDDLATTTSTGELDLTNGVAVDYTDNLSVAYNADASFASYANYVSAVVKDSSGKYVNYAKIADYTATSGTKTVDTTNLVDGAYTMYIFAEKANGDKETDYASDFSNAEGYTIGKGNVTIYADKLSETHKDKALFLHLDKGFNLSFDAATYQQTVVYVDPGKTGKITAAPAGTTVFSVFLGGGATLAFENNFTISKFLSVKKDDLLKIRSNFGSKTADAITVGALGITNTDTLKIQIEWDPGFETWTSSVSGERIPVISAASIQGALNNVTGVVTRYKGKKFTPTFDIEGSTIILTGFTLGTPKTSNETVKELSGPTDQGWEEITVEGENIKSGAPAAVWLVDQVDPDTEEGEFKLDSAGATISAKSTAASGGPWVYGMYMEESTADKTITLSGGPATISAINEKEVTGAGATGLHAENLIVKTGGNDLTIDTVTSKGSGGSPAAASYGVHLNNATLDLYDGSSTYGKLIIGGADAGKGIISTAASAYGLHVEGGATVNAGAIEITNVSGVSRMGGNLLPVAGVIAGALDFSSSGAIITYGNDLTIKNITDTAESGGVSYAVGLMSNTSIIYLADDYPKPKKFGKLTIDGVTSSNGTAMGLIVTGTMFGTSMPAVWAGEIDIENVSGKSTKGLVEAPVAGFLAMGTTTTDVLCPIVVNNGLTIKSITDTAESENALYAVGLEAAQNVGIMLTDVSSSSPTFGTLTIGADGEGKGIKSTNGTAYGLKVSSAVVISGAINIANVSGKSNRAQELTVAGVFVDGSGEKPQVPFGVNTYGENLTVTGVVDTATEGAAWGAAGVHVAGASQLNLSSPLGDTLFGTLTIGDYDDSVVKGIKSTNGEAIGLLVDGATVNAGGIAIKNVSGQYSSGMFVSNSQEISASVKTNGNAVTVEGIQATEGSASGVYVESDVELDLTKGTGPTATYGKLTIGDYDEGSVVKGIKSTNGVAYGLYVEGEATLNSGEIDIKNVTGYGDTYGAYLNHSVNNNASTSVKTNGNNVIVEGIQTSDGYASGVYVKSGAKLDLTNGGTYGTLKIGDDDTETVVKGIKSTNGAAYGLNVTGGAAVDAGAIDIKNVSGNSSSDPVAGVYLEGKSTGEEQTPSTINTNGQGLTVTGIVNTAAGGKANTTGVYVAYGAKLDLTKVEGVTKTYGTLTIGSNDSEDKGIKATGGEAIGLDVKGGATVNSGEIKIINIKSSNRYAYGMYLDAARVDTNEQKITIDTVISETDSTYSALGLGVEGGATVNSGEIEIKNVSGESYVGEDVFDPVAGVFLTGTDGAATPTPSTINTHGQNLTVTGIVDNATDNAYRAIGVAVADGAKLDLTKGTGPTATYGKLTIGGNEEGEGIKSTGGEAFGLDVEGGATVNSGEIVITNVSGVDYTPSVRGVCVRGVYLSDSGTRVKTNGKDVTVTGVQSSRGEAYGLGMYIGAELDLGSGKLTIDGVKSTAANGCAYGYEVWAATVAHKGSVSIRNIESPKEAFAIVVEGLQGYAPGKLTLGYDSTTASGFSGGTYQIEGDVAATKDSGSTTAKLTMALQNKDSYLYGNLLATLPSWELYEKGDIKLDLLNGGTWYPAFKDLSSNDNVATITLSKGTSEGVIDLAYSGFKMKSLVPAEGDKYERDKAGALIPEYNLKAYDGSFVTAIVRGDGDPNFFTIRNGLLKIQSHGYAEGEAYSSLADHLVAETVILDGDEPTLNIQVMNDPYFADPKGPHFAINPVDVFGSGTGLYGLKVIGVLTRADASIGGGFIPTFKEIGEEDNFVYLNGFDYVATTTSEALGNVGKITNTKNFTMFEDETLSADWGTFVVRSDEGKVLTLKGDGTGKNTVDGGSKKGLIVDGDGHELTVDSITVKNMANPFTVKKGTLTLKNVTIGGGVTGAIVNDGTLNIDGTTFSLDVRPSKAVSSTTTNFMTDFTVDSSQTFAQPTIKVASGANVINNGTLATSQIEIAEEGALTSNANKLTPTNGIKNDGSVTLTGGTSASARAELGAAISDSVSATDTTKGNVKFGDGTSAAYISNANAITQNAITVAASADVTNTGAWTAAKITNNGTLETAAGNLTLGEDGLLNYGTVTINDTAGAEIGFNISADTDKRGTLNLNTDTTFASGAKVTNQDIVLAKDKVLKTGVGAGPGQDYHLDATDKVTLKGGTIDITNGTASELGEYGNKVHLKELATTEASGIVFNTKLSKTGETITAINDSINADKISGTFNLAHSSANVARDNNFKVGDTAQITLFAGSDLSGLTLTGTNVTASSLISYIFTPASTKGVLDITTTMGCTLYEAINLSSEATKANAPTEYIMTENITVDSKGLGTLNGDPAVTTTRDTFTINGNGKNLIGGSNSGVKVNEGDTLTLSNVKASGFNGNLVTNDGTLNVTNGTTFSNNISDDAGTGAKGTTNFNTNFVLASDQTITQKKITIGSANILTADIDNLITTEGISIGENGILLINADGTIKSAITGSGTTQIGNGEAATAVTLDAKGSVAGKVDIKSNGQLTVTNGQFAQLTGDIANGGLLIVTGTNTIAKGVTGGGKTEIGDGSTDTAVTLDAAASMANNVEIMNSAQLTVSNFANLTGTLNNGGKFVVTGTNTIAKAIIGAGKTQIGDGSTATDVTLDATSGSIVGDVEIKKAGQFTLSDFSKIGGTEVDNAGTLILADTATITKDITGADGTTKITGTVTNSDKTITQKALVVNEGGNFTTEINKLAASDGITNNGTLKLTGNEATNALEEKITADAGKGSLEFAGSKTITAKGAITQNAVTVNTDLDMQNTLTATTTTVAEGKSLAINADKLKSAVTLNGTAAANAATAKLGAGTLGSYTITGGNIVIAGAVVTNANNLASSYGIKNDNTLKLNGGVIQDNISNATAGTGTLEITGTVTNDNNKTITQKALTVADGGNLTTEVDKLVINSNAGPITNNGTLKLTADGTTPDKLEETVTADSGKGTLEFAGSNKITASGAITQKTVTVNTDLDVQAALTATTTTVAGGKSFTIGAGNLNSAVTLNGTAAANAATANLGAGTLGSYTITGGKIVTTGDVEANADNLASSYGITNDNTLTLNGGTIKDKISSTADNKGTTKISGTVTNANKKTITQKALTITDAGNFTTEADKIVINSDDGAVTNDGTLTLTNAAASHTFAAVVKDSAGTGAKGVINFGDGTGTNKITADAAVTQSTVFVNTNLDMNDTLTATTTTVMTDKKLAIDATNLKSDVENNGTLALADGDGTLSKNVSSSGTGTLDLGSGVKSFGTGVTIANQSISTKGTLMTGKGHLDNTDSVTLNGATIDLTDGTASAMTAGNAVALNNFTAASEADKIVFNTKLAKAGSISDAIDVTGKASGTIKLNLALANIANTDIEVGDTTEIALFNGGDLTTLNLLGQTIVAGAEIAYKFIPLTGADKGKLQMKALEGLTLYDAINLISSTALTELPDTYDLIDNVTLIEGGTAAGSLPEGKDSLGTLNSSLPTTTRKNLTLNGNGWTLNGNGKKGVTVNEGNTLTISKMTVEGFDGAFVTNGGTLEFDDTNTMKSSVVNNGTMSVTGTTTFASGFGVSGSGNIINSGSFTIDADQLGNVMTNDATLTLTGTNVTLTKEIKETEGAGGITQIDGVIASDEKIANAITIFSGKSLEISADNVGGEVTNDGATLILKGGTLAQQVNTALEEEIGTIDLRAATNIAAEINNQNIVATNGYSTVAMESYIANNDLTFNGGGFDFQDNKVSNYVVNNINMAGDGNLMLDVDLAKKSMDTLDLAEGGTVSGTGKLHVTALTLLSDAKQDVTKIAFTETDTLKGHVASDVTHVASDMWKYTVAYDDKTGKFSFSKDIDAPEVSETTKSISDSANGINVAWLSGINNLQKRLGDLRGGEASNTGWARFQRSNDDVNTGRQLNVSGNLYQLGYDVALKNNTAARGYFGLSVEHFDGSQSYKIGGGDVKSTSLSAYYTKIYDSGHYFDFIFRYGRYESDTTSYDAGLSTKLDYGMNGVTLSGEYGYRANIGKNGFYFEPQAEVIYGYLAGAKKTSSRGILADIDSTNHFVTRLGVALGKKVKNFNYYLRGSYYHDFAGSTNILYGDASYKQDSARNWWELSLGGGWNMTDASYFYAELTKHFKDVSNSINFNLGFRFTL